MNIANENMDYSVSIIPTEKPFSVEEPIIEYYK